ncbi:MAG TPA: hypothetical protein V6C63_12210 [Allocoleopsis sp.]
MNNLPNFEALAQTLSTAPPIHAEIDAGIAFALVGQLQLALRHPLNQGASSELVKRVAQELQAKLADIDPAIAQALNQGWDESLDSTPKEFEQMQAGQRVVVHNIYTLYELNQDGTEAEQKLLSFSRPQDWGNPNRWHYQRCKVEFELNSTCYVNHCHLWQEVERPGVEPFQAIAPSLFMVMMPGQTPELCGRDYLGEEDFWSKDWGEMPPIFDSGDYWDDEPNDFAVSPRG